MAPADRELIVRIAVEQDSQKKIAEDLGTAHTTVRKRWERLRGQLRKALGPVAFVLLGMIGGTPLLLATLGSGLLDSSMRLNMPASIDDPEQPLIIEAPALPAEAPRPGLLWNPDYRSAVPDHAQLRSAIIWQCVYGHLGKTFKKDLRVGFVFDDESGALVTVGGSRAAVIKKCIETEVLPKFELHPVATAQGLGKPWRHGEFQFTAAP